MPNSSRRPQPRSLPLSVGVITLSFVALIGLGCGSASGEPADVDAGQSVDASAVASGSPGVRSAGPLPSGDVHAELCRRIGEVDARLTTMRAVELRLTNRVALDIELGQLQVAVAELQAADLGPFQDDLETPLRLLGYRLGDVELAVEDFRTNSRPQRAAPHVERESHAFADELAAFVLLARC